MLWAGSGESVERMKEAAEHGAVLHTGPMRNKRGVFNSYSERLTPGWWVLPVGAVLTFAAVFFSAY